MAPDDRIIATDMQLSAPALQAADVKVRVPAVYAPDYIDITLKVCKDYAVDAVFSLNDLELPILAENKSRFEELGVKVVVSDPSVIDICFDKFKTMRWAESIGLKVPVTFSSLFSVKEALAAGKICFPLFMKPRWGSGSIGLETVDDMEEMEMVYRLLQKKIKKSILATASTGDEFILFQEKLTGEEYGLDVMNDLDGNNVGVSVKRKLAMRSGETDKAVTVDSAEIRKIGETIGKNLGHIGNLDVDIMRRSNGDYCVLELNPRFGGGFPFSYESGVNYPGVLLQWLKGIPADLSALVPEYGKAYAKNDYLVEVSL